MRKSAVHRSWSNGSFVLRKGQSVPRLAVIVRGKVRIAATFDDGHEVFFQWQMPGELLGLVSAVAGLPPPLDAVAYDDCETLEVERDVLMRMMEHDSHVAMTAARLVSRHTYDLVNLVAARTGHTLAARVLGVLKHLALLNGQPLGETARTLAVSQNDVAIAVGASRQRVNAELRALESLGHIQLSYRKVTVFGLTPATSPITAFEDR